MIDLQIAVAKAMGWKRHTSYYDDGTVCCEGWKSPEGIGNPLPPLTLDLMWDAEEMLSDEQWDNEYYHWLCFEVSGGQTEQLWEYRKAACHATAEQRAKAWLKVKGVEL